MEYQNVLNEEVFLPSRGIIYPKEFNVPKSVVICPFKTRDLKGLFGANSESAVNSLIRNCIVSEFNIDCKELHVEDRTAIFTRIRAITLGPVYKTKRECTNCKKAFDVEWDMNNIECSYLDLDEYPIPITLPESGKTVLVGVILPKDAREINEIIEKRKQQNPDIDEDGEMEFLYYAAAIKIIDSVIPALQSKLEFILDCSPEDYLYLQFVTNGISFGIDNKKIVKCPFCKTEHLSVFSPTEQFFRRSHELPTGIRVSKGILGCDPTKTV